MNKIIETGKTLLINGPASVTITSGIVQIFGFQTRNLNKILIREGKRLPFAVKETAHFSIALGAAAKIEEFDGDSIPSSWLKAVDIIQEYEKKPVTVMVIGAVDAGKTGFCTYLSNRLVNTKSKVAVLDEDLGQSELGPPGTVAYSLISGPLSDFYNVQEQNAIFIGATSPQGVRERTIQATITLKNEILSKARADFIIINTDGWIMGEEAIEFKSQLATGLKADIIFCVQKEDQIPSLCATFGDVLADFRQECAETPKAIGERTKETRRALRELGYEKYFKNARMRVFPIKYLNFEGDKTVLWNGKAEDMLVGINDSKKRFLGIGVIRKIDFGRKAIKIFTAVTDPPSGIVLGKIRLDANLKEFSDQELPL